MCWVSTQHVPAPIAQPNLMACTTSDSLRTERSTTIRLVPFGATVTGTSVHTSARVDCGARGSPPSAGISHRTPWNFPCTFVPFGPKDRQAQSRGSPVHTCMRDESGTAATPVSGSAGSGVCVRVMATESPRSSETLNVTSIVLCELSLSSSMHPEMVGPVTATCTNSREWTCTVNAQAVPGLITHAHQFRCLRRQAPSVKQPDVDQPVL